MASTVFIRVDGLRELGRRIATLKADVSNKMAPRATGKAAALVKKVAKQKLIASPSIDSGLVEKNVIVKKVPKGQTQLTAEHVVTVKKVMYPKRGNEKEKRNTREVAGFLERGTVNMPAEPFLGPALSQNIRPAIDAIKDSLTADLAKAGA